LLETLSETGVRDETAIMVAGDHGEEFQEHGHLAHYPKLYDELINVPFIVDVPDGEGRRIGQQVGLDAVPPTVADLLNVDAPAEWQGRSLVPSIVDGEAPADKPVVSVTVRGKEVTTQPIPRSLDDGELYVSVRDRDWTYIENVDTGATELYHRPSDPTQQSDLSGDPTPEEREVMAEFGPLADAHATTLHTHTGEAADPAVDDDLEQQLEALGYR
jgi:arylsulfatase A-like enzyme